MTSTLAAQQRFEIGRVLQRTFGTIRNNPKILVVAAIVLGGLPEIFFRTSSLSISFNLWWLVSMLVGVVSMALMQGVAAHVLTTELQGRKAEVEDTVQAVARAFPVLIGAGVLSALGISVGLVFLVIPGLYLMMLWFVIGPVVVAEKVGIRVAFERSQDLTEGHRWWLLLLVVIAFVAAWFLGVADMLLGILTGGSGVAGTIINAVIQSVSSLLVAVGIASVYAELRLVKDGGGRETVATVFD